MKYKWKSVFFQSRCFPWKQSCGHVECSSDKPANKILRKVRKKVGIIPIENLECNEVLTTVLENSCRKPEKSPSKMRNTIWKVFFFQRRCFPWKRSCGHIECSSDRPANKILRKVRKKVGIIPIKNLECNEVLTTVLENSCRKPEKSPSKMRNTIWKVFFYQRRCFPWKRSCGQVEWNSDRPVKKICVKSEKS